MLTSFDLFFSSSKLSTTRTGAVIPSGGVPILPPKPSMLKLVTRGLNKAASSCPLEKKKMLIIFQ